jgi:hypothetical protein
MKHLALILFICIGALSASAQSLDELIPQLGILDRLEKLSQEKKYAEILDSLAADYRNGVSREYWLRKSEEIGWVITKARIGTVAQNGDFADAPVQSETIIGKKVLRIHAVAYFVRENGVWKLWNFPFVDPHLPNRLQWPPPYEKKPNQSSQPTPGS